MADKYLSLTQFQDELETAFDQLKNAGMGVQALSILAQQLQRELTCDIHEKRYKHSRALELILRGVIAILEVDKMSKFPDWPNYPVNNIVPGVAGLLKGLKVNIRKAFEGYV